MIDWDKFSKLIGNKKRKYVRRGSGKYVFISFNKETDEVTVKSTRAVRTLRVMPRAAFVEDFSFVKMTNEKPIF